MGEGILEPGGRASGLAEFGLRASEGLELDELLTQAAREIAATLDVSYVKILEYLPDERSLLVRSGVGWDEGVIGHARVGADIESPAGYALQTSRPVISNELLTEERFRVPRLLKEHGVQSAVNVIIRNQANVFGVLEADNRDARTFTEEDIKFLQSYANILSFAIEQNRLVRQNNDLYSKQEILLRELQHRTRNNNQQLLSLIGLQLAQVNSAEARDHLERVAHRIRALTSVSDHFADSERPDLVDLGKYLVALVGALFSFYGDRSARIRLVSELASVEVSTATAQAVGLIVNEFLTNSLKHALPADGGQFSVELEPADGLTRLTLSDNGPGLPDEPPAGLGLKLIDLLVRQLGGTARWSADGGTRLELEFPLARKS